MMSFVNKSNADICALSGKLSISVVYSLNFEVLYIFPESALHEDHAGISHFWIGALWAEKFEVDHAGDIDLGRRLPVGGSDSGTKKLISPKLLGISQPNFFSS